MMNLELLVVSFGAIAGGGVGGGDVGEFIPLGDLPGGAFNSAPFNLSADGKAVAGFGATDDGVVPFRWTETTGMVAIDSPEVMADGWSIGVTSEGTIFAGSATTAAGFEAFVWTPVTGIVLLGDAPGGEVFTSVADMSADGRFIIGDMSISATESEVFRWTLDGGFVGLGHLPGGATLTGQAGGCSEEGSIVVGSSSSTGGIQAFRWVEGAVTPMIGLGDLPGGGSFSHAWSPSDDGSVVVGVSESTEGIEAFRWTPAGGMVGLGDLPGGPFGSQANDVSADGSVVVGLANYGNLGPEDGFIWTEAEGMRNIQDVLENEHGLAAELAGWDILGLTATTPDGRAVVGWGTNPTGGTEAFLARFKPLDAADVNGDGVVDVVDLLQVLANWG